MTVKFAFNGTNQDGTKIRKTKTYMLKQTQTRHLIKEIENLESMFDASLDFEGESDSFKLTITFNRIKFEAVSELCEFIEATRLSGV